MAFKFAFAAALLVLGNQVSSMSTARRTENMSAKEIANLTWTIDRQLLAAWECLGQSCLAADASGSSGRNPTVWPEGGKDADKKCIARYNPAMSSLLASHAANGPKQSTGVSSMLMGGLNSIWRPLTEMFGSTVKGTFTGTCSKNILIFAKGTLEPGAFGILVGPSFTSGLPAGWTTYPVRYDPDIPGDYCLGLPGGMVAKDIINQAAQKCPTSNLFLSGYSQGAMVARNGIAYAEPSAKAKVKVLTRHDGSQPSDGTNSTRRVSLHSVILSMALQSRVTKVPLQSSATMATVSAPVTSSLLGLIFHTGSTQALNSHKRNCLNSRQMLEVARVLRVSRISSTLQLRKVAVRKVAVRKAAV